MKFRSSLIIVAVLISLMMTAASASAVTASKASILYQEQYVEGGWQYDYTFYNNADSEYLYGVFLDFGGEHGISSTSLPTSWSGSWGMMSPTSFIETHSYSSSSQIEFGDEQDGFSFIVDSQIGNVQFTAFFDDGQGNRTPFAGTTVYVPASPPVVPEPVSSILFITGGAALAFRKRFKRKQ